MSLTIKQAKPETLRQAQTWEVVKRNAQAFGLCHTCAARMAFGVRDGFDGYPPPCASCQSRVDLLPRIKGNGWRSPGKRADSAATWNAIHQDSQSESLAITPPMEQGGN